VSENRGISTSGTGMSSINKVIEGRAATVLQPEQYTPGQSRKTMVQETPKTRLYSGISRQGRTYQESFDITYKEGVAGSNPASPTTFFLQIAVFCV
jgi:hypothetical protein